MSASDQLQAALDDVPLTAVCRPRQSVVTLEHSMMIADAMKTLAKHSILSAPLVAAFDLEDLSEDAPMGAPLLLGWVDVTDILRGFLAHLREKHDPLPTRMLQLMTILEEEGPRYAHKPLVTLNGGADRGLLYQANANNSLLSVVRDSFLKRSEEGSSVVHRVAVFDAYGEITNLVSQTDVLRFLAARLPQMGGLGDSSIESLGILSGKPPVVSCSPHQPCLLAYQQMLQAGVQGAAVVADSGELIANLSLSDMRCIQPEHLGVLALPVGEFLAVLHGTVYVGYSASSSTAATHPFFAKASDGAKGPSYGAANESAGELRLITCTRHTTFAQLLDEFLSNHVHRVFIVEDQKAPRAEAVVSMTDVLRFAAGVY